LNISETVEYKTNVSQTVTAEYQKEVAHILRIDVISNDFQ